MTLRNVVELTEAEVLAGRDELDRRVERGCGADLLSDVLAVTEEGFLLVTGMVTSQAVRVAEVMNAVAVLFVRGKRPRDQVVAFAESARIPLLCTAKGMFDTCGILYSNGLVAADFRHVTDYVQ
ncbi:MAG: DRTGG domain-containing protein [Candidatus Bipolaricaulaceae bacterium]